MMTTTRVSSSFCIVVFLVFISTSSLCFPRTTSAFGMTTTTATAVPAVVSKRRDLPEKIIVGYTTRCSDQVVDAVRNGVNVVIWSFVELVLPDINDAQEQVQCVAHFDLDCVKRMIQRLDLEGYTDTVHLVSFGGWNGPHLPDNVHATANDMYNAFIETCGDVFHGIDWDLEGHDNLQSKTNVFTVNCLENMGRISQLCYENGYIVGMAPPQSYFDISSSKFSRYVNYTDTSNERDDWHNDFHYFGRNVYAYLYSKYEHYIDFVSIQFYESYSRAGLAIYHKHINPAQYLVSYIQDNIDEVVDTTMNHHERSISFYVNFDQEPLLNYTSRNVVVPLSKLVFGFPNGWAAPATHKDKNEEEKALYIDPKQIDIAYNELLTPATESSLCHHLNISPRGFMFWVIDEEGTNDIHFTTGLNNILRIRTNDNNTLCSSDEDADDKEEDKEVVAIAT